MPRAILAVCVATCASGVQILQPSALPASLTTFLRTILAFLTAPTNSTLIDIGKDQTQLKRPATSVILVARNARATGPILVTNVTRPAINAMAG